MISDRAFYTRRETASTLALSERTIDRLIRTEELRACRIGRSVRISQAALEDFVTKDQAATTQKDCEK